MHNLFFNIYSYDNSYTNVRTLQKEYNNCKNIGDIYILIHDDIFVYKTILPLVVRGRSTSGVSGG